MGEPVTMTTYRPRDPENWRTEWTWTTTLTWAQDAAEADCPVDVVEEMWQLVSTRELRVAASCAEIGCEDEATHWGLCEAHAREDDPEAFS